MAGRLPTFEMGSAEGSFEFFEPGPEDMPGGIGSGTSAPHSPRPAGEPPNYRKVLSGVVEPDEFIEAVVPGYEQAVGWRTLLFSVIGIVYLMERWLPIHSYWIIGAAAIAGIAAPALLRRSQRLLVLTDRQIYLLRNAGGMSPDKVRFAGLIVKCPRGTVQPVLERGAFGDAKFRIGDRIIRFRANEPAYQLAGQIAAAASGTRLS